MLIDTVYPGRCPGLAWGRTFGALESPSVFHISPRMVCRTSALSAPSEAVFSMMATGLFDIVRFLFGVSKSLTTDYTEFTD